jgi:hypothetical protein
MISGSFVKALKGVIDSLPKIIKLTFNHADGHVIGLCKIDSRDLPGKFKRPIIIEAFGRPWRVLKANPYKDFISKRKLSLVVVEPELADQFGAQFFYPTIAGNNPEISTDGKHEDFIVDITIDEWRQVELLPSSFQALVSSELESIELIRNPGNGISMLSGYDSRHIREKVNDQINNVSFEEFCRLVGSYKIGAVRLNYSGLVKNGFVVQSDSFTYYGSVQNNIITNLCVHKFDFPDSELLSVLSTFDLLLANWCDGNILTAEVTEAKEEDQIPANNDQADF